FDVPESFGSLVIARESVLRPFHLSVLEFASDRAKAGRYWAAPAAGRQRLADYCSVQYESKPDAMPPYALEHGAEHLTEVGRAEEAARLLLDYRILSRRIGAGR